MMNVFSSTFPLPGCEDLFGDFDFQQLDLETNTWEADTHTGNAIEKAGTEEAGTHTGNAIEEAGTEEAGTDAEDTDEEDNDEEDTLPALPEDDWKAFIRVWRPPVSEDSELNVLSEWVKALLDWFAESHADSIPFIPSYNNNRTLEELQSFMFGTLRGSLGDACIKQTLKVAKKNISRKEKFVKLLDRLHPGKGSWPSVPHEFEIPLPPDSYWSNKDGEKFLNVNLLCEDLKFLPDLRFRRIRNVVVFGVDKACQISRHTGKVLEPEKACFLDIVQCLLENGGSVEVKKITQVTYEHCCGDKRRLVEDDTDDEEDVVESHNDTATKVSIRVNVVNMAKALHNKGFFFEKKKILARDDNKMVNMNDVVSALRGPKTPGKKKPRTLLGKENDFQ